MPQNPQGSPEPRQLAPHLRAALARASGVADRGASVTPKLQGTPAGPRAPHVLAALGAVQARFPPQAVRAPAPVLQLASTSGSSSYSGGTPSDMLRYCCDAKFLKHVALDEKSACEKAANIMRNGGSNRDICTTFVLTDEEVRNLYLQIQIWRTSNTPPGNHWAKMTFSKCVEAKLSGMKLWTGVIEAQIGFDGEKADHLQSVRGGIGTDL